MSTRATPSKRQTGLALGDTLVQPAQQVGSATDPDEREADAVAARVVRILRSTDAGADPMPVGAHHPTAAHHLTVGGVARIHRSSATFAGSTNPTPVQPKRIHRAAAIGAAGGRLDEQTDRMLRSSRAGGKPLPEPARSKMEGAFGTDFGNVRVHSGGVSTELNDRIQAKAFTTGHDIYFRDSLPDTSTSGGQELLAHELTHTIQQRGVALRQAAGPAPIRRKIGHHAKKGDEVYGNEDGVYAGVKGVIVEKVPKKRQGMNLRLPRMGGGINIPNPLPAPRVLSTKKGHDAVTREVDHYVVQTIGPSAGQEPVKPEDKAWESVDRDTRKAAEGSTLTETAGQLYGDARSKAKGHAGTYEELGGGGSLAIVVKYGEDLASSLTDLGKVVAGRVDMATRYGVEVAGKWKGYALTAADYLGKSLTMVSKLVDQINIPEPTLVVIQKALKEVKKIITTLVKLAKMYSSFSHSQTQGLMTLAKSAEATGYAGNIEAIAMAISGDDEMTEKTKVNVPATIRAVAANLDKGIEALSNAEQTIRGKLGGAAI